MSHCRTLTNREVVRMAGRLDGKVAVVTGASSGIGVETARTTVERIELARLLSIVERAGRLAGTPTP